MVTLVVDANGELTLPKALLENVGARAGDTVELDFEEVEIAGVRHPYLVVRSAGGTSEILIAAQRSGRSVLGELLSA